MASSVHRDPSQSLMFSHKHLRLATSMSLLVVLAGLSGCATTEPSEMDKIHASRVQAAVDQADLHLLKTQTQAR